MSAPAQKSAEEFADELAANHDPAWLRMLLHRLDENLHRTPLERLISLWGISPAEAAEFFGVSRQAFSKWQQQGTPPDRAPQVAAMEDATALLERYLKRERIAAVVRRPSPAMGGKSLIELASTGRHEDVLSAVRAMFDLRRVQP